MLKKFLIKILLVIGSVLIASVVSLFVVEVGFRAYGHIKNIDFQLYRKELANANRLPAAMFDSNRKPWQAFTPNSQVLATTSEFSVVYRFNSLGYRDDEYSRAKPANKTRILLFGDSFTFGEGVPDGERFSDSLEKNLKATEVINFGVPGAGIDEEFLRYREIGKSLNPNLVVLAINWVSAERNAAYIFYEGRVHLQLERDLSVPPPEYTSSSTAIISKDDPRLQLKLPFSELSYFLSYLEYRLILRELTHDMSKSDQEFWAAERKFLEKELPSTEKKWVTQKTISLLKEFQTDVENSGAKFVVINIDDKKNFDEIINQLPGLTYFDYQPRLAELSQREPLTFTYDPHYSPATHKAIGQWLSADIKTLLGK